MIRSSLSRVIRALRLIPVYRRFKPFTMIDRSAYLRNLMLVQDYRHVPGAVVECGTWKGGMSGGMACVLGPGRTYYLFDSFEGLPPVKEIDGEKARQWQENKGADNYFDNCRASEDDARAAMKLSGVPKWHIVKGWFEKTLPGFEPDDPNGIAILRLDGDWYESTMTCLQELFPKVAKGGIVIFDDYYAWEGCSRALHDYFAATKSTCRVRQFMDVVAYVVKE